MVKYYLNQSRVGNFISKCWLDFNNCNIIIYGNQGSGKSYLSHSIVCLILKQNDVNAALNIKVINRGNNSNIDVEQIRDIKRWFQLTSFNTRYKILIVDNACKMTINAYNSFLKILEEPIGQALIIINCTLITKIPKTILSRCVKFKVHIKRFFEFKQILKKLIFHFNNCYFERLYDFTDGDLSLSREILRYSLSLYNLNDFKVYDVFNLLNEIKKIKFAQCNNKSFFFQIIAKVILSIKIYIGIQNYLKCIKLCFCFIDIDSDILFNALLDLLIHKLKVLLK